jgi:hypothetical protein
MRFVLLTLVLIAGTSTLAQTRAFPGERLEPGIDAEAIGHTDWAGVPDHFGFDAAVWLDYENAPLASASAPSERREVIVENRVHSEVALALAVFDWVQLGLDVPVLLYQSRNDAQAPELDRATPLGTFGLGDIAVRPKIRILRQLDGAPLDIALLMALTVPTGQSTDYFGAPGGTFAPGIAASRTWGDIRAAVNVLHRFRDTTRVLSLEVGNELLYRAALSYRFVLLVDRPTDVGLSVAGAAATNGARPDGSTSHRAIEALVDVQHKVWGPFDVFFGAGAGLVSGFGVPDFRLFGGLRFSDRPASDYDEDGIVGAADHCPRNPEHNNGINDDSGCPDDD